MQLLVNQCKDFSTVGQLRSKPALSESSWLVGRLPTGGGKSLCYPSLPYAFDILGAQTGSPSIVVVSRVIRSCSLPAPVSNGGPSEKILHKGVDVERLATACWQNDQRVSSSHECFDSAALLLSHPAVLKSWQAKERIIEECCAVIGHPTFRMATS